MTINVHLRPLQDTRTPDNTCKYEASCTIDGVPYTAQSRNGATCELARVLVAANLPDQPLLVTHEGLIGTLTWQSFHQAAEYTYRERKRPLHRVPYVKLDYQFDQAAED